VGYARVKGSSVSVSLRVPDPTKPDHPGHVRADFRNNTSSIRFFLRDSDHKDASAFIQSLLRIFEESGRDRSLMLSARIRLHFHGTVLHPDKQ
jgi:hypothetical protein